MKFRKKPVVIEAEQFWTDGDIVTGVCYSQRCYPDVPHVHTAHDQTVDLADGDWIVPEPDGNGYYPIMPHIMRDMYDRVED